MLKIIRKSRIAAISLLVLLVQSAPLGWAQADFVHPAVTSADAARFMMLDTAMAGARIVAVGEHGYILLSDDGGKTHRQAKSVPVSLTLTAVAFADAKNGWAVGHGATILHTVDGGETWTQQHRDMQADQPLLSVYFADARHGWAAGIWSLLLETTDGGATWSLVELAAPANRKRADVNLFKIVSGGDGKLYIAGEQGMVLHSADAGKNWSYLSTGYAGSLWSGAATTANTLVMGGLRGKLLRSTDGGRNWSTVQSPLRGSVTQIRAAGNRLWATGLDGGLVRSDDDGINWQSLRTASEPVTALGGVPATPVLYAKSGVLPAAGNAAQGH